MLPDGTVKVFSRNSEDMTSKCTDVCPPPGRDPSTSLPQAFSEPSHRYPDLAAVVPRATADGVSSFIIDAEAVAVAQQSSAQRGRRVRISVSPLGTASSSALSKHRHAVASGLVAAAPLLPLR